jgi:hypothetical protein
MKKILLLAYTRKPCVNSPNYNVIALVHFLIQTSVNTLNKLVT